MEGYPFNTMIFLLFEGDIFEWIFDNYLIKSKFSLEECESGFLSGNILTDILSLDNLD